MRWRVAAERKGGGLYQSDIPIDACTFVFIYRININNNSY